ncbi:uncharacterized protein LY79DRAFT_542103 [Colletotrichum navitas]|uniref:Uncharacterized protein n=1 Tax=Colletotrichum navitas TaxID=681940 RepID=A0AAD8Q774_9PEZI|nr:uncharacterized protein LY79DRAFT_542103 [Colletotrichum navitas]KAK1597082.1 hypothetical protein LY79DRAFT_542103 [Colletotrichum navitas]
MSSGRPLFKTFCSKIAILQFVVVLLPRGVVVVELQLPSATGMETHKVCGREIPHVMGQAVAQTTPPITLGQRVRNPPHRHCGSWYSISD